MEFKIKLLQFNIKALCLTDFIIAKFWFRIFTVNNFLVTFLLPQSDGKKIMTTYFCLILIISVFGSIIK